MEYLEKSHTSSGRIPSEKGYRLYVEEIMRRNYTEETEFPMLDEIFERPNISYALIKWLLNKKSNTPSLLDSFGFPYHQYQSEL